jgi:hypothetical protein
MNTWTWIAAAALLGAGFMVVVMAFQAARAVQDQAELIECAGQDRTADTAPDCPILIYNDRSWFPTRR